MVDFLGIGVQKGGTTWLYQNLVCHPDVWLPFIKEVHFFNRRFLSPEALDRMRHSGDFENLQMIRKIRRRIRQLRKGKIVSDFGRSAEISYLKRLADRNFFMTDQWYDYLFSPAPPGNKTGEITPYYCAIGEAGIIDLKQRFPAVRLIYLVRDPVDRALSCMRMVGRRSGFDMTDPRTLAKLTNRCLKSERFCKRGDFRSHIPLWDRHFGGQVLYIPFGLIRSDPQEVFRRVESFIGVRPFENYPLLREPVHTTDRSHPLPDEVRRRFAEVNLNQYCFLKSRFAPDFIDELR